MSRVVPTGALIAALVLIPAAGAASGSSPDAHAARKCSISGQERSFGTTYVTSLSVRRTKCSTGKSVVRAFHACRKGPRGRCHRRVNGYRCSENRFDSISVQFSSRVTCKRGGKRVRHTYTQNT
jgi:hypothetical protein